MSGPAKAKITTVTRSAEKISEMAFFIFSLLLS